jgi:hypothetical protein
MIKIKEKIKQKGVAGNAFMCYITSWLITVVIAILAALWVAQTTSFLAVVPPGLNSARPAGRRKPYTTPIWGSRLRWANYIAPPLRVANLNPLPLIFAWLTVNL